MDPQETEPDRGDLEHPVEPEAYSHLQLSPKVRSYRTVSPSIRGYRPEQLARLNQRPRHSSSLSLWEATTESTARSAILPAIRRGAGQDTTSGRIHGPQYHPLSIERHQSSDEVDNAQRTTPAIHHGGPD